MSPHTIQRRQESRSNKPPASRASSMTSPDEAQAQAHPPPLSDAVTHPFTSTVTRLGRSSRTPLDGGHHTYRTRSRMITPAGHARASSSLEGRGPSAELELVRVRAAGVDRAAAGRHNPNTFCCPWIFPVQVVAVVIHRWERCAVRSSQQQRGTSLLRPDRLSAWRLGYRLRIGREEVGGSIAPGPEYATTAELAIERGNGVLFGANAVHTCQC